MTDLDSEFHRKFYDKERGFYEIEAIPLHQLDILSNAILSMCYQNTNLVWVALLSSLA
jgi:hypothetical protein